jgi:hypothetical protein
MRFQRQQRTFARLVITLLITLASVTSPQAAVLKNPIVTGADPGIAYKDGTFLLVQSDACAMHV